MSKNKNKMANKARSFLKTKNRDFNNVLDSVQLNLITSETISAARTLTQEDSGKVFFINQASAYTITLPLMSTISSGWNATFILATVGSHKVTIANNTAEDTIVGSFSTSEIADSATATLLAASAVDEVAFISGASLGNVITLISNGVNYFANGQADAADHITIS